MPADIRRDPVVLRRLIDSGNDIITVVGPDLRPRFVSGAFHRILGYEDRPTSFPADFVHPDDRARMIADTRSFLATGQPSTTRYRLRHADGRWRWMEVTSTDRRDDPHLRGIVSITRDITEHREAEEQLRHLSTWDTVTDLPNRAVLLDRIQAAVSELGPGSAPVGILVVRVDGLVPLNRALGRDAGDRVLHEVARRVRAAAGPECVVGRYAGTELVVVHAGHPSPTAAQLAGRIREATSPPLPEAAGAGIAVGVTVAVHETANPGITAPQAVAFALAALHSLQAGRDAC